MVDKMLGRYIPKRDSFDIRGTCNEIISLFKVTNLDGQDNVGSQQLQFIFKCDEKIPPTVITYGQEIMQSLLLIIEFTIEKVQSKLIAIDVWYTDEKAGAVQIRVHDRKLYMS